MSLSTTTELPQAAKMVLQAVNRPAEYALESVAVDALEPCAHFRVSRSGQCTTALGSAPLHVWKRADSRYEIIDGVGRFEALRATQPHFWALVHRDVATAEQALVQRIVLNAQRPHTLAEMVAIGRWLRQQWGSEWVRACGGALGLASREFDTACSLLSLPDDCIDAVEQGDIHAQNGADFAALQPSARQIVCGLSAQLRLSVQAQREILEWLPEIADREQCTVEQIVQDEAVVSVLGEERLTGSQKIERVRELLYARRFPTYWSVKQNWQRQARQLNPDSARVVLTPSSGFEKDWLEIRLQVNSGEQAWGLLQRLAKLDATQWQKLVAPAD